MSWKKDYDKTKKRLKKRKRTVEVLLMRAAPPVDELKAAVNILGKTIATARNICRRKPASLGANRKNRRRLQSLNKDAKRVYDAAVERLAATPVTSAVDKLPQPTVLVTESTYVAPASATSTTTPLEVVATTDEEELNLEPLYEDFEEESFIQAHPLLVSLGALAGVGALVGGIYYVATRSEREED